MMIKQYKYIKAFIYRLCANIKGYKIPLFKGYDYDYWYGEK